MEEITSMEEIIKLIKCGKIKNTLYIGKREHLTNKGDSLLMPTEWEKYVNRLVKDAAFELSEIKIGSFKFFEYYPLNSPRGKILSNEEGLRILMEYKL